MTTEIELESPSHATVQHNLNHLQHDNVSRLQDQQRSSTSNATTPIRIPGCDQTTKLNEAQPPTASTSLFSSASSSQPGTTGRYNTPVNKPSLQTPQTKLRRHSEDRSNHHTTADDGHKDEDDDELWDESRNEAPNEISAVFGPPTPEPNLSNGDNHMTPTYRAYFKQFRRKPCGKYTRFVDCIHNAGSTPDLNNSPDHHVDCKPGDECQSRPVSSTCVVMPDLTSSSSDAGSHPATDCDAMNSSSLNAGQMSASFVAARRGSDSMWEMNYHEAAIYLQEGRDNEKFLHHPKSRSALPIYLIVHNRWFYAIDLLASILLLALSLGEKPAVPHIGMSIGLHASLELLILSVVSVELIMKFRWMGIQSLSHTRTAIKLLTLIIMILEALVVLIRQDTHIRVTRALRPVFLVDNHHCGGIRRVIRQILQSLPPILDVLLFLFFFILIFSIIGFYLFASNEADPSFKTLGTSFISLFVLLTTANYPDVMMPAYNRSRWSSLFFISFVTIHVYFIMNLMLAVVYESFTRKEKDKFRKLMLHRRAACQNAFRLLVTCAHPTRVSFHHFYGLMRYYQPTTATKLDVYLMFKWLDKDKSGFLNLEEFYRVYERTDVTWEEIESVEARFAKLKRFPSLVKFGRFVSKLLASQWFEISITSIIAFGAFWQVCDAAWSVPQDIQYIKTSAATVGIIFIYTLEAAAKIFVMGTRNYFNQGWNIFDASVTGASLIGLVVERLIDHPLGFIFVIRSLRLLKLFTLKRRYRDILGTFLFMIVKRLWSVSVVVCLLYYFYAIIGLELFADYDLRNCCGNTSVEIQYTWDPTGNRTTGYYYLNNFSNLLAAFVTLFELMAVNNWYIHMEGYAHISSDWSRLFFISFYLTTMVVVTIVVAFVLEAFLFRIQYRRKMTTASGAGKAITTGPKGVKQVRDMDSDMILTVEMALSEVELKYLSSQDRETPHSLHRIIKLDTGSVSAVKKFRGTMRRSKFSFQMKMYADELAGWIEEDLLRRRAAALKVSLQQQRRGSEAGVASDDDEGLAPPLSVTRRTYSCSK